MIKKILLLIYGLFSLFWLQAQSPGGVSTNLVGWYSADVSATATTWADRSTQGNNLTGTGTPTFTNLLNFNPVATFNGTSQRYSTTATTASWPGTTTANTYYYVAVPTTMNTSRFVFGKGTGTTALNGMHSGKGTTATTLVSGATGTGTVNKASVWAQNVPTLVRTGYDGSPTLTHYISNNNTAEQSAGSSNPTYAATSAFAIGSQNTSAGFWDGDIAEVIVYSGKHAPGSFNRIQSYLALKYGINLGSNYVNSASTVVWTSGGGYDNNIAGIGRDDMGGAANSGLNQKQSKSQNTGIQPVIGNVNIASTNAANTNTFGTNLSALVWGSDTGSTSFATSFAFGNLNNRMTRIWRVQETGTVGTVKVAIPASDLSGNITFPTLVVSSDAVFDGSDTRTTMTLETLGGVQYYTATVDFTTGQFFTFAALVAAPGGVSGSSLWYKADAGITQSSGFVTQWDNQASSSYNLVQQGAAGTIPAYNDSSNLINFNPAVNFDGTNDRLYTPAVPQSVTISGSNPYATSQYIVYKQLSGSNTLYSHSDGSAGTWNIGSFISNGGISVSNRAVTTSTPATNEVRLQGMDGNSNAASSYLNGTLMSSTLSAATAVAGTQPFWLGANGTNGFSNAAIAEVIAYNTAQPTNRRRVESYLALKYGITLGSTSSVVNYLASDGTTILWTGDATYQNNIAGIARDDASALNQKQSQSQNSGIQPVIGNVNIAATNAANTNNFTADLSALVWGSDTGSTNFATSFVFGGLNNRMTRIWKVQETGTVGTVKVALPATDLSVNITSPSLVVSSDAVFNGSDTITGMTLETLGGVQYYTATVDFTTGQFFTFAAFITAPGGVSNGLTLWLDAQKESLGIKTSLTNYAGNGINITKQGSGSARVVAGTANFNNQITMSDAGNVFVDNSYFQSSAPILANGENTFAEFYVFGKPPYQSELDFDEMVIYDAADFTSHRIENSISVSNYTLFDNNYASNLGFSATPFSAENFMMSSAHNGTLYRGYSNGFQVSSLSTTTGIKAGGTWRIGTDVFNDGNTAWNGTNFNEVLVYSTTLSDTELLRIHSYLSLKYGITLGNTTTPVNYLASDGTTVFWTGDATYQNNIAVIARDDASGLNQKQSASVNAGIQPVIGNGNIFDTNANNTNNFTADLTALVWGSDAGSSSFATSFAFGGLNNRMARIWKVQETGTVGTVKVALRAVDLAANVSSPTFVVSPDATFDGTDTRTAMTLETLGGVQYYTATVDFTSGQFFTFAAFVTAPGGVTSGLKIWHKADADVTAASNLVTAWTNQTDNTQAVNSGGTQRPTLANGTSTLFNFNNYLDYTANTNSLQNTNSSLISTADGSLSVFSSIRITANGQLFGINNTPALTGATSYDNFQWFGDLVNQVVPAANIIYSPTQVNAGQSILSFTHDGAANQFNAFNNLTSIGSSASATQSPGTGGYVLGNDSFAGGNDVSFLGQLSEYIAYDRVLSASEIQRVRTYLAVKTGITLNQNHLLSDGTTNVWNTTTNSGYNNNIAGIGRDDISGLTQKQSTSINTGTSQVIVALGTIAATNQANANTIPTDKQFFIWGDDNGSLTTQVTTGNNNFSYRFTRVWKTQNTGSFAQNITVYYPVSAFGNALPATVALLYGTSATALNNGTASAIAQSGTTTINGVSYYVFTVPSAQVANMQFFSFAGTQSTPGGVSAELWLKADLGTSSTVNGSGISQWNDQTGNNNNVAQGTAGNQPLYFNSASQLINFNPVVKFDGSNDELIDNSLPASVSTDNTLEVVAVGLTTDTSLQAISHHGPITDNSQVEFLMDGTTDIVLRENCASCSNSAATYTTLTGGIPSIVGFNLTNGTTNLNALNVYKNLQVLSSPTTSISGAANITNTTLIVGARRDDGNVRQNPFNGSIPEYIIFQQPLSSIERARVYSYAAIKYGVTLDQTTATNYLASDGTTILWNGTSNAAYKQNIAGIGRDDLSALYQKQSQSVNSGSQVVMSLGTVAASNQANANTIPTDKQFFVWGDDNGSLSSLLPTGLPASRPQYRFTRVWKTQNTGGFAQDISVYYPVSAFGNAPGSTISLLFGSSVASLSNGTATYILQGATTVINSVSYYVFTVPSAQVANMQFFSFTGTQTAPGGVIGADLWLKADVGTSTTTDAVAMSQWDDQSGNVNNVSQATAANRPLYRSNSANLMNFNPAVSFDGTNDFMDATTFTINGSANTLFSAVKPNVVNVTQDILGFGAVGSNNGGEFRFVNATLQYGQNNGTYVPITSGSVLTAGTPLLFGSSMNNAANGASLYQNNRTITTGTIGQIPSAANLVSIGSRTIGSRALYFNGLIPEVVTYNSLLTVVQRQRINSYFAIKYGITIDQTAATDYLASDGTTILWNSTSNASYLNNIAGIGRDDLSALYQKQSQSVNSGSQVVMSLGTVAASNQANANTIAADKQFFIWGDDNGSISNIVSTGNGTYSYRLTRIWKTQNTGSFAQNITVYYPVSAFGSSAASSVALLYGTSSVALSNGTASAIAQSGTSTINGVSYYAFTVPSAQVANMQFFSFTALQTLPGGVAGVNLWLKADAGTSTTTNGATLSTWADQSGQRTNLATTSSGLQTFKNNAADNINFNPAVYFDGLGGLNFGNDYIFTPAGNGGVTLFASAKPDNAAATKSDQFLYDFGSQAVRNYALVYSNTSSKIISATDFGGVFTSTTVSNGLVPTIIGGQINFGSNQFLFNNALQYNTTAITLPALTATEIEEASTHGGAGAGAGGPVSIGRQSKSAGFTSGDTRAYQGHLGEIIHYSANLTAIQRLRVNTYLALKYGTTLTRNNDGDGTSGEVISGSILEGDYVASDGTTRVWNSDGVYLNNIAGIGRDDLTALYQKQSQSVNSGSQVVMALGTVAASNQVNANTIPTDKQFFIWGDDNGSLSNVVATGNSTYPYRFTRVWKTQNTASFAQNMTVYYPVNAFGNASASTVALLYGANAASLSNGTASAIAQSGTTTINGASYYVFTVSSAQVANMQSFSFAGTQTAPGGVMDASLWIRADAGTSTTVDGAGVTTWADQSGKGNNLTQNNSSFKPTYAASAATMLNYNPVVSFDGTQFTNVPSAAAEDFTAGMSIFTVHKYLNATADGGLLSLMSGSNTDVIRIGRDNTNSFYALQTYNGSTAGPVINTAAGTLLTGNYSFLNWNQQAGSPGATVTATVSFSGLQQLATSSIVPSISGSRLFSAIGISPNFDYFNGYLPEIIIYNRNLSSTQQQQVNSYIAVKYGLTISHNYLSSNGTTTYDVISHSNNIAGIGRDDLTALYQKQSQSQNTGSQVVMALGTAAASNQANAGTIPTDKQFFIWGDDNGSLSTFVSTGNITYPSRFTRIWKTQNTGTFAENMTVYYPVSAFGTSLAAYVGLIYGSSAASLSNGSASVIAQSGTTTINGVSYYVFTVPSAQVAGMQFFSFTGNSICYKPAVTVGTTLDTKHGITALNRAGTAGDNWPMVRKGAWTVLEAKTKGFVINRLTAAQIAAIPPANLVEGMMVYDTTNNCMKVYTSTDGGTTFGWQCITTQTCPD